MILSTLQYKRRGKDNIRLSILASYVATGKKVLLIGADLRNPQVHNLIDIDRKTNNKGLSTLISEKLLT